MFETILVPLDGSVLAEQALPYVTELASRFASEVTLIGICEPEETDQGEICRLTIENKAGEIEKMLAPSGGKVKSVVIEGRPAQQIVDYAENSNMGLIILTSHGRSGIMPWSLGSTSQKIIHLRPKVPLLLIKAKEVAQECNGLYNRILVPVDGSETGEAAVPYVLELVRTFEAEVILLRVVEKGHHVHTVGGLQYIPYYDQDIETSKANAEIYLAKVAARFAGTRASLRCEVRTGDVANEILKITEEQGDCLIAISSHGHSGISAWTFGSVTDKIVQASNRPILLIKA